MFAYNCNNSVFYIDLLPHCIVTAIQNSIFTQCAKLSSPKLLINRWTFSNPHQLFWSTSVEVNKAGFPALKEDFVPSAKLASCYIQVLNSNKIELKRLPKKKIQSRRIASRQDWISGKYFCSAKSLNSNLKWG